MVFWKRSVRSDTREREHRPVGVGHELQRVVPGEKAHQPVPLAGGVDDRAGVDFLCDLEDCADDVPGVRGAGVGGREDGADGIVRLCSHLFGLLDRRLVRRAAGLFDDVNDCHPAGLVGLQYPGGLQGVVLVCDWKENVLQELPGGISGLGHTVTEGSRRNNSGAAGTTTSDEMKYAPLFGPCNGRPAPG